MRGASTARVEPAGGRGGIQRAANAPSATGDIR
jgi:hypothetical protein